MKTETIAHPNGWELRSYAREEDAEPFLVERHVEDAVAVHHEVRLYVAGKLATTSSASKARGRA